ncbi:hypothetical protein J2S09_003228 [Bacillus fengqiuensis]|nr:hypothetical protein [Bacillus fengqiuensis]
MEYVKEKRSSSETVAQEEVKQPYGLAFAADLLKKSVALKSRYFFKFLLQDESGGTYA